MPDRETNQTGEPKPHTDELAGAFGRMTWLGVFALIAWAAAGANVFFFGKGSIIGMILPAAAGVLTLCAARSAVRVRRILDQR
jgi:hypothetical protein